MLVRVKLSNLLRSWVRSSITGVLLLSLAFTGVSFTEDAPRKVIARTNPVVPELARKMHLSGKVKVEVAVNPAGAVTSAKMVGGNPVFESNAIDAVKQWKFEPADKATKTVIALEFTDQ